MNAAHKIVAGGGWKKPIGYRVKFKAVCCFLLALVSAGVCADLFASVGVWIFTVPSLLFTASVALFWFEQPSTFPGTPDGGDDPRKLYGRIGGTTRDLQKPNQERL